MSFFSVEHADVVIGENHIIRDATMDDGGSDFTCIIGPNGAGKSTLLGLLNGLVPYAAGRVTTLGTMVTPKSARYVRCRVGYVSQFRHPDPRQPMTVFEAVLSGTYGRLGFFVRPGASERDAALAAMEAVGVAHLADRPIGSLSGGESQKTAIARALAQDPELMLLDEPTASLDWQAQREVVQLISRVHTERHIPVVMVTHDLNLVGTDVCHRVICVKSGRVFWQGDSYDAMDGALLSRLFDVPVTIVEHKHRHVALA